MKKLLPYFLCLLLCGSSLSTSAQLANRDYADLLRKSILFFEAQACGPNAGEHSSFNWRGNCHPSDGQDLGLDLTGGWHDAGDHVKFNYPMGQAVYNLATLYVDRREAVDNSGNKDLLIKQLRFVGDYMIKCHPEPNSYVIQVAQGEVDHSFWEVPEENNYERKSYMADLDQPNTELAGANAAAFAALSMAFRGEDDAYSDELLQHARDLYDFGYQNQVSYNDNTELPDREFNFYDSDNGFQDELMVGAAWLYRATEEQRYRDEAAAAFGQLSNYVGGWAPAWGDHQYEAAYQMARATGEALYLDAVERYVVAIADGSEGKYSPGGMWQASAKGSTSGFALPMSLGAASLAYRYADLVGSDDANYDKVRDFAFNQVNYALGDNPLGRSYVVDVESNFPQITHHRAAHSPNSSNIDSNPNNDSHTISGALVMGPILDDSYDNTRSQIKYTEPAVGNNGILALVAGLMVAETGSTANPPEPTTGNVTVRARGEVGGEKIEVRYKDRRVGGQITLTTSFQEYQVQVDNPNGNFKVAFVNDGSERDAIIDWLEVEDIKRQAEEQQNNTAAYANGSCGGGTLTEIMNCNGYIDFGTFGGEGNEGKIVVRARGECGLENMELHVDGSPVQTWQDIGTSFADYTYTGFSGSGEVSVHFTNNNTVESGCEDKNLEVDFISVCGTTYQTEEVATETSDCCAEVKDKLYTNGNFNFGTLSCEGGNPSGGSVVVRAKGSTGNERMRLRVDGQDVKTWTKVSATAADYTYDGYNGGAIDIVFDNDSDTAAKDRNLLVDYITVCGEEKQAESAIRSRDCGQTQDGFVELWCNSTLDFGNVGCGASASTARTADGEVETAKGRKVDEISPENGVFESYPNPASQELQIIGPQDYGVTLYDLTGRVVLRQEHLQGAVKLNVRALRPGTYLMRMRDAEHHQTTQRVIID